MKIFILFFTISLHITFIACENESNRSKSDTQTKFRVIEPDIGILNIFGKDKNGYQHGKIDIVIGDDKYPIQWIIHQNSANKPSTISLPASWYINLKKLKKTQALKI